MFERYTESARRSLFFARMRTTDLGAEAIEPEHLVLGILSAGLGLTLPMLPEASRDALVARLEATGTTGRRVPVSVEMPFSRAAKEVLTYTVDVADEAGGVGSDITPLHLLMAILVKTDGVAAHALHEAGVTLRALRALDADMP